MTEREKMTDGLAAGLEKEAVAPSYPCPECGAESLPHGEPERYDESERICSAENCRKIQSALDEVPRQSENDESPRFPCVECGRETKVYRSGRVEVEPAERVCSNEECRNIFEP